MVSSSSVGNGPVLRVGGEREYVLIEHRTPHTVGDKVVDPKLDGLVVVLFNGSDDASYNPAFDLDGFTTDADGYFVIGSVAGADLLCVLPGQHD